MSMRLRAILANTSPKPRNRQKILDLVSQPVYEDGRTKQSFADETNIEKIMARAARTGTTSHLEKFQGVYADFSDFDFFEQTRQLTRGREIFDELPAEVRQEFGQSPAKFFAYVNDPANIATLEKDLPALAQPGRQLIRTSPPTADEEAAIAAPAASADPITAPPAETPA